MKKILTVIFIMTLFFSLLGCSPKEKSVFDKIKESPTAKMELPNGNSTIVDSEIRSLYSFCEFDLLVSTISPSNNEIDWIYRIVFNPSEKVKNSEEIVISVYSNYLQIDETFYTTNEGVDFNTVIEWFNSKFTMFMQ